MLLSYINLSLKLSLYFNQLHKLLTKYNKLSTAEYILLAYNELNSIKNICTCLTAQLNAKIIYYNYYEINDAVFGNYSNKMEPSFYFNFASLIMN